MTQPPNPLAVALEATAALNAAELELANLRAHLTAVALEGAPAYTAARSARIVADSVAGVADKLHDLAARQSLVENTTS